MKIKLIVLLAFCNFCVFGQNELKSILYQIPGSTDYCQIIMYGQSLSIGYETIFAITSDPLPDCYMLGSSVHPTSTLSNDNTLKSLINSGSEDPTVSLTNAFSYLFKQKNPNVKFIGTSCGKAGYTVAELSRSDRYPDVSGSHPFEYGFKSSMQRIKELCDMEGKTVSCSAIIWMQGEADYYGDSLSAKKPCSGDKYLYKKRLLQLKNDMQDCCKEIYGQENVPLFFMSNIGGSYISNRYLTINMAQKELAEENLDMILMNPHYAVPHYAGAHLSENGYRMYGEMMAKHLWKVFGEEEYYKPVYPERFSVEKNIMTIDFYSPSKSLTFDTLTLSEINNYGFRVWMNDNIQEILNVQIKDTSVILTTKNDLLGTIDISYGGYNATYKEKGFGNLRDEDHWESYYTYWDDTYDAGGIMGSYWKEDVNPEDTTSYQQYRSDSTYKEGSKVWTYKPYFGKKHYCTCMIDAPSSSPFKPIYWRPKDENGHIIIGKKYPIFNWCINFYQKLEIISNTIYSTEKNKSVIGEDFYNVSGTKVIKPTKGFFIKVIHYSDFSFETQKVVF